MTHLALFKVGKKEPWPDVGTAEVPRVPVGKLGGCSDGPSRVQVGRVSAAARKEVSGDGHVHDVRVPVPGQHVLYPDVGEEGGQQLFELAVAHAVLPPFGVLAGQGRRHCRRRQVVCKRNPMPVCLAEYCIVVFSVYLCSSS